MKTYLFYDIETSGLSPEFDQVLTWAAIRTDPKLNELERESITVRLRPDIVPSVPAFLTHGLPFDELKQGISEYKAAKRIHRAVNRPGTISLGYNSLGFDDDFLRFLFYRNLLDPYSHQYSQGCGRADILPMAVVHYLFHPDGVKWPVFEGKPSLKLENISRENNFQTSGRAHEAMNDVEAVIALSCIFFQNQDIWTYTMDFFNKTRDEIRVHNFPDEVQVEKRRYKAGLMLSASFGSEKNYLAPVICLGASEAYKNQSLWLRLDKPDVLGRKAELPPAEIMVIRKRSGDAYIVLPVLDRFFEKMPDESKNLMENSVEEIKQHPGLFHDLISYHRRFKYPFLPDMDPDGALYQDGFFTLEQKKDCALFHRAIGDRRFDILKDLRTERIRTLAQRILYRNFQPRDFDHAFGMYMKRLVSSHPDDRITGYRNRPKRNLADGFQQLANARKKLTAPSREQQDMLIALEQYFTGLQSSSA